MNNKIMVRPYIKKIIHVLYTQASGVFFGKIILNFLKPRVNRGKLYFFVFRIMDCH